MPRPLRTQASTFGLATALCCAALGPATLHTALAAAAGTLFEAAPFVLVAEILPKRQGLRTLAALAGCGCGAVVPGALSFVALGLCWLTFGPAVTFARALAGVVVLAWRGHPPGDRSDPADPFSQLLALAPSAAVAAVCSSVVASHATALAAEPGGKIAAFAIGLTLGAFAPCGTAAVAIAAALSPQLPFAAAGVLVTGGLVPRIVLARGSARTRNDDRYGGPHESAHHEHQSDSGCCGKPCRAPSGRLCIERIALGLALGVLALGGPRGFINARLVPFEGFAAAVAFAGARRTPGVAGAFAVPLVLFVALAAGSPEPSYVTNETRLDDAFAGERIAFTGVAHRDGKQTIVQRFAITCCRVDASAIAVRTTAPLPVADGSWIRTTGVLIDAPSGLLLRPNAWREIASPLDPFVYR